MGNQSSHKFAQWLYQTKTFASFYGQSVGKASSVVFWDKLKEDFLHFIPKEGKILEIGSGAGLQAIKVLQYRRDVEIIASDFSSEMISLGNRNYQELISRDENIKGVQSNLSFVQADAMDLSQFGSKTFDGIYSMMTIKHFPDPICGLNECIRILKPGGRMFFSEFFAEASLTDIMNFAEHLRFSGFFKPIISRFLHKRIKERAPYKEDIENWKNELCSNGFSFSEYFQEYPFFIFQFERKEC